MSIENDQEKYSESFERASADLEILCAAYPEEIMLLEGTYSQENNHDHYDNEIEIPSWFPLLFTLNLTHDRNKYGATITMEFPIGYPTLKSLEVVSYRCSPSIKKEIIEQVVDAVRKAASDAIDTFGGEECGLSCCAAAIDCWNTLLESEQQIMLDRECAVETQLQSQAKLENQDDDINWITSDETLVDRKSVFQAHVCFVSSEDMVTRAVNKLINGSTKIQRATHNMVCLLYIMTKKINNMISNT